jgi:glucose-1-phosphate cytidylyltransferase
LKVVILAGGLGTRITEESHAIPKPMIEIGGRPMLWHIMKLYGSFGFTDFLICCGYKGYVIKEYFANYFLHMSDVTFCLRENRMEVHRQNAEPWNVTLVDTGESTMTGGRIARVESYLSETFCLTYGDGLSDSNIADTVAFHRSQGKACTVTAVQPAGRFGALEIEGNTVISFQEKPDGDRNWINGGFFVCEPSVIERITGDDCIWEKRPLEGLARDMQLSVHKHHGFWAAMDTLRDKFYLERLWSENRAPWKLWDT